MGEEEFKAEWKQVQLKDSMQILRVWMEKIEEIRAMGQGSSEGQLGYLIWKSSKLISNWKQRAYFSDSQLASPIIKNLLCANCVKHYQVSSYLTFLICEVGTCRISEVQQV